MHAMVADVVCSSDEFYRLTDTRKCESGEERQRRVKCCRTIKMCDVLISMRFDDSRRRDCIVHRFSKLSFQSDMLVNHRISEQLTNDHVVELSSLGPICEPRNPKNHFSERYPLHSCEESSRAGIQKDDAIFGRFKEIFVLGKHVV